MIKGVETGNPWENMIELALGLAGKPVLAEHRRVNDRCPTT